MDTGDLIEKYLFKAFEIIHEGTAELIANDKCIDDISRYYCSMIVSIALSLIRDFNLITNIPYEPLVDSICEDMKAKIKVMKGLEGDNYNEFEIGRKKN